jgi:TPR repeat protein
MAKVRAAAEVFGAGTSAGSASDKQVKNRDGDPGDCKKASPDSTAPPAQCGAPVRLVLAPIAKAPPADAPEPPAPAATVQSSETACPTGMVLAEGKCTRPGGPAAFQCRAGDGAECTAQCDKGHAGSCATLGEILVRDRGDMARAASALKKACDGGNAGGCATLGTLTREGRGVTADAAATTALFDKACAGGEARGCTDFGRALRAVTGAAQNESRARTLLEQGCNGGDPRGCNDAAEMAASGKGGATDPGRALSLYTKACDGGEAASCNALGELYDTGGPGIGKNPVSAEIFFRRGCYRGSAKACAGAGRAIASRPMGDPSNEAKLLFERGCTGRVALACAALKVNYGDKRPFIADPTEKQALTKSCTSGNKSACVSAALLDAASGQVPMAKVTLEQSCNMGDKWACALASKLKKP